MTDPQDADVTRLASAGRDAGDPPTAWFERLYADSASGTAVVPWDRRTPNPLLVQWLSGQDADGRSAMVVCSGLGRDSEYVASRGYATTGFDVSATAVAQTRLRYPQSSVHYEVADLLDLPPGWRGAFDLVVESHNVQSLPPELLEQAAAAVAALVRGGGCLLVLGAVGDGSGEGPPWPLTRAEMNGFAVDGLRAESIEIVESNGPRWQAVFRPA